MEKDIDVIKYIKKFFIYNKDGTFKRLDRKGSLGSIDKDGYIIFKIKGKQYKAHRLVFAYFNGYFPNEIDHINRIRNDNRIENLRSVTRAENIRNTAPRSFGIYIDSTKGLKKNYAFKLNKTTYRYNTLKEAIESKIKMGGKINYEFEGKVK